MKYNNIVQQHGKMMDEKGWGSIDLLPAEAHMMMISEVAKATKEWRKGVPPIFSDAFDACIGGRVTVVPGHPLWIERRSDHLEGEAIELADVALRIMTRFYQAQWNLDESVVEADGFFAEAGLDKLFLSFRPLMIHRLIVQSLIEAANPAENELPERRERRSLAMAFSMCERRCYQLDAPLDHAITYKMAFNATRSYRHGGKKA